MLHALGRMQDRQSQANKRKAACCVPSAGEACPGAQGTERRAANQSRGRAPPYPAPVRPSWHCCCSAEGLPTISPSTSGSARRQEISSCTRCCCMAAAKAALTAWQQQRAGGGAGRSLLPLRGWKSCGCQNLEDSALDRAQQEALNGVGRQGRAAEAKQPGPCRRMCGAKKRAVKSSEE